MSFYITYVLLLTTGVITFIEALRTGSPTVRHVMNLETCISLVAAYFYSQFVISIEKSTVDYTRINQIRYTDWFITTPLMLLVLSYNVGSKLHIGVFAGVIFLNFAMLWLGFQGENGGLKKPVAWGLSFVAFGVLFGWLGFLFVWKKGNIANTILFSLYLILWSFYGWVYFLEESTRTVVYNGLDAMAKCMVGLILWAYYTKILVV